VHGVILLCISPTPGLVSLPAVKCTTARPVQAQPGIRASTRFTLKSRHGQVSTCIIDPLASLSASTATGVWLGMSQEASHSMALDKIDKPTCQRDPLELF
jgi:hypothetical protein